MVKMMLSDIHKILVIKLRAIGDVVMSTVVLDNLREAFPKARIDFLTEFESKDILLGNPVLNQVIVFDRRKAERLPAFKRSGETRRLLSTVRNQRYDLVFDFFGNPRSAWLTWISGARYRVGYNYRLRRRAYNVVVPSRADSIHEVDWHLDALQAVDVPVVARNLNVYVGQGSRNFADSFWQKEGLDNRHVIAINFSGGWATKRWPLAHFAHLIDLLNYAHNAKLLIVWGPEEKESAMSLQQMATTPALLIPETNLTQLAAILAKVDMMVTTDSGPMHIAAAMGKPCVAIFGPTNPKMQGPYGKGHEIITKNELACLGCNRLDCSHVSCMASLTVKEVNAAVEACIQKNNIFAAKGVGSSH